MNMHQSESEIDATLDPIRLFQKESPLGMKALSAPVVLSFPTFHRKAKHGDVLQRSIKLISSSCVISALIKRIPRSSAAGLPFL